MDLQELFCKDVNTKLFFYINNELSRTQRQAVESHLAGCARCRKELEALAATQNLLREGFQTISGKTIPLWVWIEIEQRLTPSLNRTRSSRFSGVMPRIKSLVVWQPRWRLILSTVLAVAVVISTALVTTGLLGPSPEVLAAQIATGDPGVTALLQGKPKAQTAVVAAQEGYVMTEGPSGESVLAYVDLPSGTVAKVYRLSVPPLTEEDKTGIAAIALADKQLREILTEGFALRSVSLLPTQFRLELAEGEPRLWSEDVLAEVVFRADGQTWIAIVDLIESKVIQISQPQLAEPQPTQYWFYINPPYSREELVNMAWTDTDTAELLDDGAEIVSAVAGGKNMEEQGALILKLGDNIWVVRIDLASSAVTAVEPVPVATWQSGYFFRLGNGNTTT